MFFHLAVTNNNRIIAGSPTRNKIILACLTTDVLEIYDSSNGLEKRFQGPLGIQLTIKGKAAGILTMRYGEPKYYTYGQIIANENEFWVTYLG